MLKVHHSETLMTKYARKHAANLLKLVRERINRPQNNFLNAYFTSDAIIREILYAKPRKLLNINEEIYKTLMPANLKVDINDAAKRVFNYSVFSNRDYLKYRGDDLYKLLDFHTCPYCNLRDIKAVLNESGQVIMKQAFDHFFADSKFPFLAISFYNLVPCCTPCNTNFKRNEKMKLKKNTHPYLNGYDKDCTVDIKNYVDIDSILAKTPGHFDIFLNNVSGKKPHAGNNKLFRLDEQYRGYKDDVRTTLRKTVNYGRAQLKSILILSKVNGQTAFETTFGTKHKFREQHQKALSKMNSDIVRKYGSKQLKKVLKVD